MPDFSSGVMTPNFMQGGVTPVDTSWLARLPSDYFQGQQQQRQLAIMNAPHDATPAGSTTPDLSALTNRYLQLGDLSDAGTIIGLGLRQRLMNGGSTLDNPMGGSAAGSMPAAPASIASAPSAPSPYAAAVSSVESGGDYGAQGPVTKSGDRAYGRYQIMGSNIGPWTSEILGQSMTPAQFMANPSAQDAVFQGKFAQYVKQTANPADAFSMWFSGKPLAQGANASDQLGTTGQAYVEKAMAYLRNGSSQPGQSSSAIAYALPPPASPAQAAIGAATGQPSGPSPQSPYRVASLGPTAAPVGTPAAAQPSSPPPPGFGADNGRPTANTAASQMVSPAQWASKFDPNDPTLPGRIADAIGVDPNESIDVQDVNIRKAVLPVLQASRRAALTSTAAQQPAGAPPNVESGSQDQAPSSVHPFGPGARSPESGNTVAPFHAPAPTGASAYPPAQPAASGFMPTSAPNPAQAYPSAPPAPRFAPAPPSSGGPDIPGLPAGYQDPGGGQRYVNQVLNMASQFEDAGMTGRAKVYMSRAQQVQAQLEAAQKSALDVQAHNAEMTNEQKNFAQMQSYGFGGSPLDLENQQAQQKADARARANAQYGVVEMQQPDGTTVYVPRAQVLNGSAGGGSAGPVVKSQPAYVTQGQSNLLTKLNDGSAAYQERQIAGERLNALGQLLSTYQTGANSTAFNDAAANLRSFGLPVPNTATINPAAMQQFAKDAYANVLSSMREQGNKQFVSEVQSAINSNPNPDLQPEANAAMVAQIKGIQDYRDQNYRDYADWYGQNKGASNDANFQTGWAKQNPLSRYITAARKEIAPLGAGIPAPDQRVVGQRYAVPGKGVFRWQGNGQWTDQ